MTDNAPDNLPADTPSPDTGSEKGHAQPAPLPPTSRPTPLDSNEFDASESESVPTGEPATEPDLTPSSVDEDLPAVTDVEPATESETARWLDESDYVPEVAAPVSPPGPGLLESAGWIVGFIVLQIFASIVMLVVVIVVHILSDGPAALQDLQSGEIRNPMLEEYIGLTMGGIQIILMLGVAVAAALRLGKFRRRLLPLKPVAWRHLLLIGLAWIPIALLSVQLNLFATEMWKMFVERFPQFDVLSDQSSMETVKAMVENASFGWILLGVAIGPAIGEELVFRGIIGRGLIARWGLPVGITITTLLFAAVHVQPAHVFSLLPLAVFLHVAHIATRSLWAPILLHFLNNLLAVSMMVLFAQMDLPQTTGESPRASFWIIAAGVNLVVMLIATFWSIRLRFFQPDGTEWTPGYPTAEYPPEELATSPVVPETPTHLLLLLLLSFVLFIGSLFSVAAQ